MMMTDTACSLCKPKTLFHNTMNDIRLSSSSPPPLPHVPMDELPPGMNMLIRLWLTSSCSSPPPNTILLTIHYHRRLVPPFHTGRFRDFRLLGIFSSNLLDFRSWTFGTREVTSRLMVLLVDGRLLRGIFCFVLGTCKEMKGV